MQHHCNIPISAGQLGKSIFYIEGSTSGPLFPLSPSSPTEFSLLLNADDEDKAGSAGGETLQMMNSMNHQW